MVKTILTLMLVALWATASNHCRLEQFSSFKFMVCCEQEEAAPHEDDDCKTDGCCLVEDSFYKTENSHFEITLPATADVDFTSSLLEAPALSPERISRVRPDAAPPNLSAVWRFSVRAAAPPRAPSLTS